MVQEPKPKRGMPRSLIYAMIPIGFILLVLIMMFGGFWTEETEGEINVVPGAPEEAVE